MMRRLRTVVAFALVGCTQPLYDDAYETGITVYGSVVNDAGATAANARVFAEFFLAACTNTETRIDTSTVRASASGAYRVTVIAGMISDGTRCVRLTTSNGSLTMNRDVTVSAHRPPFDSVRVDLVAR